MEMRTLGKSGIKVSGIGLGLMSMSGIYGNANDEESIRVIHYALDKGINLLDSADMYGWGHNEELLGRALKGHRDGVIVATKFGQVKLPDGKQDVDGSAAYVQKACEASLKRLGVDVIDLYYQHRVDDKVPIEETIGAMKRLVDDGKVRYLGMSEAAPATLRRAHQVHPIAALQTEYSLWSRDPEAEVLPTCRELGIGFVPYSPLGRGFLSGRFRSPNELDEGDFRRSGPRFSGENLEANLKLASKVAEIAAEKGITPAQLALAWVLAQGDDLVPIPGTKRRKYLEENAAAADVELSADDLARIAAELPPAAGARYDEAGLASVNL